MELLKFHLSNSKRLITYHILLLLARDCIKLFNFNEYAHMLCFCLWLYLSFVCQMKNKQMKEKKFNLKLISDDDDKIELLKMKFHGNFNSCNIDRTFPFQPPQPPPSTVNLIAIPPMRRRMN